jgi:hypothetical protein
MKTLAIIFAILSAAIITVEILYFFHKFKDTWLYNLMRD